MRKLILGACVAIFSLGMTIGDAEARRLGGGKSSGMQRDSVTQRQAAPAQQNAAPATTSAPAAAQPKRNWMGPIAGLAAGLGIAALLSHFGLGEGVANFLMIALLVMAAIFVFRLLFSRKAPVRPSQHDPIQFAGVGGPGMAPIPNPPATPVSSSSSPVSDHLQAPPRAIPDGFDVDGFLRIAKLNFVRMQAANDAGNLEDLKEFLAPELFAEVCLQIQERGAAKQDTDVVALDSELLEVVTEGSRHIASVRFKGMIREEIGGNAVPFDEVWNLIKPVDGDRGWQVAGIQQLS
ncbi:MAG: Tim44 domain-containing protein [Zoogloeaceae bacterium]|nr:Tim44 domain-containing protein [Zoogloeaceae bacterium]